MKPAMWLFLMFVAAAPVRAAAADPCETLKSTFDAAIHAKQGAEIEKTYDAIAADVECDFTLDDYRTAAVAAEIAVLADPAQAAAHQAALKFVTEKLSIAGRWQLAKMLGDYFYRAGDRAGAKQWYENALSFSRSHPANPITEQEKDKLTGLASGSWILASNDEEGHRTVAVIRTRGADGSVGGVLALDRGAKPVAVPLPINFVYAKTDFTPVGQAAADDLAQAIHEQGVKSLELIGHADPRGDRKLNLILSRERAEHLRAYLLAQLAKAGDAPDIRIEGVGDEQPFDVSVLPVNPSQDETYALDRRVEFVRGPE